MGVQGILRQVAGNPIVANKVFLHLHCTMALTDKDKQPLHDGPAWLFREAIKRQSRIDMEYFRQKSKMWHDKKLVGNIAAPGLPWTWFNDGTNDIFWIDHITGQTSDEECREVVVDEATDGRMSWQDKMHRMNQQGFKVNLEDAASERASLLTSTGSKCGHHNNQGIGSLFPISLGRADMKTELEAIGRRWFFKNIDIYVCGNDKVVKDMRQIVVALNDERRANESKAIFSMHFERFG